MLSDRLRPNVEAAPWVIEEIIKMEQELAAAYLEMRKIRPAVRVIFDHAVWDRSEKPNNIVSIEENNQSKETNHD